MNSIDYKYKFFIQLNKHSYFRCLFPLEIGVHFYGLLLPILGIIFVLGRQATVHDLNRFHYGYIFKCDVDDAFGSDLFVHLNYTNKPIFIHVIDYELSTLCYKCDDSWF